MRKRSLLIGIMMVVLLLAIGVFASACDVTPGNTSNSASMPSDLLDARNRMTAAGYTATYEEYGSTTSESYLTGAIGETKAEKDSDHVHAILFESKSFAREYYSENESTFDSTLLYGQEGCWIYYGTKEAVTAFRGKGSYDYSLVHYDDNDPSSSEPEPATTIPASFTKAKEKMKAAGYSITADDHLDSTKTTQYNATRNARMKILASKGKEKITILFFDSEMDVIDFKSYYETANKQKDGYKYVATDSLYYYGTEATVDIFEEYEPEPEPDPEPEPEPEPEPLTLSELFDIAKEKMTDAGYSVTANENLDPSKAAQYKSTRNAVMKIDAKKGKEKVIILFFESEDDVLDFQEYYEGKNKKQSNYLYVATENTYYYGSESAVGVYEAPMTTSAPSSVEEAIQKFVKDGYSVKSYDLVMYPYEIGDNPVEDAAYGSAPFPDYLIIAWKKDPLTGDPEGYWINLYHFASVSDAEEMDYVIRRDYARDMEEFEYGQTDAWFYMGAVKTINYFVK